MMDNQRESKKIVINARYVTNPADLFRCILVTMKNTILGILEKEVAINDIIKENRAKLDYLVENIWEVYYQWNKKRWVDPYNQCLEDKDSNIDYRKVIRLTKMDENLDILARCLNGYSLTIVASHTDVFKWLEVAIPDLRMGEIIIDCDPASIGNKVLFQEKEDRED